MTPTDHPPCGVYRTTRPLETVPAGRLVYFHNHGDPGPGIYLPQRWSSNRAQWHRQGITVPDTEWAASLEPLLAEGLYRVKESFHCCERRCQTFAPEQLVQLGYTGEAQALLFVPEWTPGGLGIPERGTAVERAVLSRLARLQVPSAPAAESPAGGLLH